MVLPLMGLLGLAGAAVAGPYAREHARNTAAQGRADRFADSGLDFTSGAAPEQYTQQALTAGILPDVQSAVDNAFGTRDNREALANALQRTRISSGPGYMNAQLAREKFEYDQAQWTQRQNSAIASGLPVALASPYGVELWERHNIDQMFGPQVPPVIQEGMARYGENWELVEPEVRQEILADEQALTNLTDVEDYVDRMTYGDRITNPQETAQMQALFDSTVLPFLQQDTGAGALQKEEIEIFRQWVGNPFGVDLTGRQRGRLNNIIERVRSKIMRTTAAHGLTHNLPDRDVPRYVQDRLQALDLSSNPDAYFDGIGMQPTAD